MGKQVETFVLNANAELTFENLRHLRASFLCPKLYGKTEWIKGKSGQIGSVQYQELADRSRSYELKIVGINEHKKVLDIETLDYREPYAHSCHCPYPHHQAHEAHDHQQAKVRLVRFKVSALTNSLAEDAEGEPCERCIVKWVTKLSCDSHNVEKHLQGIKEYKKQAIQELQDSVKDKSYMSRRQQIELERERQAEDQ